MLVLKNTSDVEKLAKSLQEQIFEGEGRNNMQLDEENTH